MKLNKTDRKITLLAVLLTLFLARPALSIEKEVSLSLEEKQIQNLTPSGLSYVFYINIANSSAKTYFLSGYSYRFITRDQEYIRLQTGLENPLEIRASGKTMIALTVRITYELLFQALGAEFAKEDKISCYLMGELAFSDGRRERGRLPFAFSGDFPIFKEPGVEPIALKAAALTLGGADLSFEVRFKNNNSFDLLADRINYSLKVGGVLVGEGAISGDKNLGPFGEKTFSIPLLLDFFELGQGIYDVLKQASAPCQFSGEMELSTVWGRFNFPFDLKKVITVVKASLDFNDQRHHSHL